VDRLEKLLTENFQLKREMAYEKKRYLDLMNAFLELRNSIKGGSSLQPHDNNTNGTISKEENLMREKQSLEHTLMNLTEEVETLS
jgi:oligoendopeptidase F